MVATSGVRPPPGGESGVMQAFGPGAQAGCPGRVMRQPLWSYFLGVKCRRDLGHSSSPNNSPQAPTQDKFHLCSPEDRPRDGGGRSSPGVQVCEGGKALERMVMG